MRIIINQPIRIQYYLNQVSSTSGSCSSLILSADTLNFLAALLLASCSVLPLTQHSSSVTSGAGLPWTNQRPVLVCVNQSEMSMSLYQPIKDQYYLDTDKVGWDPVTPPQLSADAPVSHTLENISVKNISHTTLPHPPSSDPRSSCESQESVSGLHHPQPS